MFPSSSTPVINKTTQTVNFFLSPIDLEKLRDQQKKEIQEQRNEMNATIQNLIHQNNNSKNYIVELQFSLASQNDERQYLEDKLTENQARHKEELDQVVQHFRSGPATSHGHQDPK